MKYLITLLFISALYDLSAQNKLFEFREHRINLGEKHSFMIPVKSKYGDSTFIPITILNGNAAGPVLGLIAGIHGYEYPPIIAMQRLPQLIDLNLLKGTVIIVHMANAIAFFNRSVFYNPADGKNLNRVFPGNKDGTISECIAHLISTEIIPRCDFLVDIHAGDASEDLHPYVGYYNYKTQTSMAKQMAEALGFPWVIVSENNPTSGQPSKFCSAQSISNDIPTVAIEYGKLGQVSLQEADFINSRLINMMQAIGFYEGTPQKFSPSFEITKRSSITAEHSGIFYTEFKSGALIRKGTKLGFITDVFGNVLQEIISPVDGFIIYLTVTPPINKGETLFSLGEFDRSSHK
jgi:predicted deacylase